MLFSAQLRARAGSIHHFMGVHTVRVQERLRSALESTRERSSVRRVTGSSGMFFYRWHVCMSTLEYAWRGLNVSGQMTD